MSADEILHELKFYLAGDTLGFLLTVGLLWLLGRFMLRDYLRSRELQRPAPRLMHWLLDFAEGLAVAVALLLIAIVPAWLAGCFSVHSLGWSPFDHSIDKVTDTIRATTAGLFLAQSLFEELLFRGVLMALVGMLLLWLGRFAVSDARRNRRVWFWCGLMANLLVSVGFAYVHHDNPDVTKLALVNIGLAGYFLGAMFWYQRNLWGAWGAHFMWNWGLTLVGLPVSGITITTPQIGFGFLGATPSLLSGGYFGPEGGVLASLGMLAACVFYTWLAWRWANEHPADTLSVSAAAPVATTGPGDGGTDGSADAGV